MRERHRPGPGISGVDVGQGGRRDHPQRSGKVRACVVRARVRVRVCVRACVRVRVRVRACVRACVLCVRAVCVCVCVCVLRGVSSDDRVGVVVRGG